MASPRTTVTERITRVSDDELNYEFTVDDPAYYTRSWKGETHFTRTEDRLLEYSCQEGNYSLTFMLQGARVRDGQGASDTGTVNKHDVPRPVVTER